MDGMHLADGPSPNPFADLANRPARMPLVAKLCHDFVFLGGCHDFANFMNRMSQRFFAIDMLSASHSLHRYDSMRVIGSANHHGIDLLFHLIEHDSVIFEFYSLGILLKFLAA